MRNLRAKMKKFLCIAVAIALCLAALPFRAAEPVEAASRLGSVTFSYELTGCTFRLYYIGKYTDSTDYELSDDFENTSFSRTDIEEGNWFTLALTLDTIVLYANISPAAEGQTDSDGIVTFSGLKEGIYLMTADTMTVDGETYTVTPMIIQMPGYYTDGSYEYDREITISKYDTKVQEEYTDISVQKVWDDDNSASRPESVTVYLLKGTDGEIYDSITLSADNNWRYTWSNLDATSQWRVAEEDMTEYGVSYSYSNDVIVITNQQGSGKTHNPGHSEAEDTENWYYEEETDTSTEYDSESGGNSYSSSDEDEEEITEEDTSTEDMIYEDYDYTEDDETEDDETEEDTDSSENDVVYSSGGSTSDKLPQTGLDWGPAAYLVLAAAVCFLIGFFRSRSNRKEEE